MEGIVGGGAGVVSWSSAMVKWVSVGIELWGFEKLKDVRIGFDGKIAGRSAVKRWQLSSLVANVTRFVASGVIERRMNKTTMSRSTVYRSIARCG